MDDHRFVTNKTKYYTQFVLLFLVIVILAAGQFVYIFYFEKVDGVVHDGSPYLPEYRIEYTSFTSDLLLGI